MKLRWHILWSMLLSGFAFAAMHSVGASDHVAYFVAIGVFVLYWLGYAVFVWEGDGPDFDWFD